MPIAEDKGSEFLTISQLTYYISQKFERDPYLKKVIVKGEVSNFRPRARHQYFSLKDDKTQISAVMYQSDFKRLPFDLKDGQEVIATGRVTVYDRSGQYQLVIQNLEPDGLGALYLALAQLKEKLSKEGVLDRPRRPIPIFPKKIAVITSPSGAVIRDIITTIKRRYPIVQLTVFPTLVQGAQAAGQIVSAFQQVSDLAQDYDTVILARGGGSIEDLWPFNEERVARAIIACPLPVISSVGHETDTTIADLVADLRAPTPTAAAEQAVPVLADVLNYLQQQNNRLYQAMRKCLQLLNQRVDKLAQSYVFKDPSRLYRNQSQTIDWLDQKLKAAIQRTFQDKGQKGGQLTQRLRLQTPIRGFQRRQTDILALKQRLLQSKGQLLLLKKQDLQRMAQVLDALSPLKILARGYAVVEKEGQLVASQDSLQVGDQVGILLKDGSAQAEITQLSKEIIWNNEKDQGKEEEDGQRPESK